MKNTLTIIFAIVCALLVTILFTTKRSDNAQHESDVASITEFSNTLSAAQAQIKGYQETVLGLSNRLDLSQSAVMTFSNQLAGANATVVLGLEQIANLTQQVAAAKSENEALDRRMTEVAAQMTAQMAALTNQIALTQTNLAQAQKEYALLENRFRIDVAERVVAERKFNNPAELQAQLQNLKMNPAQVISEDGIYASLDVEVKSNRFHVITPN